MQKDHLHKTKEIVVIKLNIDSDKSYNKLRALEKLHLLSRRIHDVCKILKYQKPYATWIICWREYGIRDRKTKSISNSTKDKLKKIMLRISKQYPNLVIIAGSVLTRKIKPSSYLDKIKKFYDELSWIDEIEKEYNCDQVSLHKDEIAEINEKIKNGLKTIKVTANKTRVFYHGIEKRHGKTTPFNENGNISNAIYQPGKGNNLNPVFEIHDAPLDVSLGIDICREHIDIFHYLKNTVNNKTEIKKPLLHFVISNTVNLDLTSICAKYAALHIDSDNPARMILTRHSKNQAVNVSLYQCDVMKEIDKLGEPIKPIYPIQFKLLDAIDEKINHPFCSKKQSKILQQFRNEIVTNYADLSENDRKEIKNAISVNELFSESLKKELTNSIDESEASPVIENIYKDGYVHRLFASQKQHKSKSWDQHHYGKIVRDRL